MTDQLIKCTCCGEDMPESESHIDPDLKTPVCPECKIRLRWAMAWLKKNNIPPPPDKPDR